MSLREQITVKITEVLETIRDPRPVWVTREPFDSEKLAITQYPAILVQTQDENRLTTAMGPTGTGRRIADITIEIRGFVRGTELDRRRNELIEAIESQLDQDRYLGLRAQGVMNSQVRLIEVIERQPPLAEFRMEFVVNYNYLRGNS